MKTARLPFGVLLGLALGWQTLFPPSPLHGGEAPAIQHSPMALAKGSFQLIKESRFRDFAQLIHPAERKKFKAFAARLYEAAVADGQAEQVAPLFKPFADPAAVAKADDVEVLAAFMQGIFAQIPGGEEYLAKAEVTYLGEVKEDENTSHIVYRQLFPRAQLTSCLREDGKWSLLLAGDMAEMMQVFEQRDHFRKLGLEPEEMVARLADVQIQEVQVLGHVADGEDAAQVVCRTKLRLGDYSYTRLGAYPVRRGEPAWESLDDPERLAEALKTKWSTR